MSNLVTQTTTQSVPEWMILLGKLIYLPLNQPSVFTRQIGLAAKALPIYKDAISSNLSNVLSTLRTNNNAEIARWDCFAIMLKEIPNSGPIFDW